MERVIAIDPPWCGCTECLTGQYVPLNEAKPEQIADMLAGKIRNNTARQLQVSLVYIVEDEQDISQAQNIGFEVIADQCSWDGSNQTWMITSLAAVQAVQQHLSHMKGS